MGSEVETAKKMFNAYNEQGPNPWKTWDDKDVPRWDALNDQVRAKWVAAAIGARAILPEAVARVCHEVNRAYCAALGDKSQLPWEDAPQWQKDSAIKGVEYHLADPASTPADSHKSWLTEKERDGWKFGPVKDPEKKEHPCFVPYEQLPKEQQAKDYVFLGVVRALCTHAPVSSPE